MFIVGGNQSAGGYEVDNSCRFEGTSNDNLTFTPASTGNRSTFTISFWVKRAKLGGSDPQRIFSVDTGTTTQEAFVMFETDDTFRLYSKYDGSNLDIDYDTNRVFRDTSAWYHMVWRVDTTESTQANRVRLYVNGVEETSFGTQTEPAQNDITRFNEASRILRIGERSNGADDISCYLAEVVMLDGQALDPTSFGEFDEDSGIWKPKAVSGLTFGTNGFYLPFENSAALGQDDSGNGNNFTVNNLTSVDQSTDTPTNNFATINPIDKPTNSSGSSGTLPTLSNGNLSVVNTNAAFREARSTYYLTTGKWYWEIKMTRVSNTIQVGVVLNNYSAGSGERRVYQNNGFKYIPSSSSYGATYTTNDIIGVALNLDDGEITFYKNGTTQGVAATDLVSGIDDTGWTPAVNCFDADCDFNFGSPPFTISSGNSDADGYGNFEYSVPSGYYALNTKNLAEYG